VPVTSTEQSRDEVTLLRSLVLPLFPASLIFVLISALLASFVVSMRDVGILRVVPLFFLLSWLFKYAYNLLEHVANGNPEPPVLSVEMLGPFEQRPLTQLVLCALAYALVRWVGGVTGVVIAIAGLAVLPASMAVLGVNRRAIDAIDPEAIGQVIRGLGNRYLLVFAVSTVYAVVVALASLAPLWSPVRYALAELALLSVFSLIGGVLYERRLAVGFEPANSPERRAERLERADLRQRDALLDEVYKVVRARSSQRAIAPLQQWLSARSTEQIEADVREIGARALAWDSDAGRIAVAQCLIAQLLQRGKTSLALELLLQAQARLPAPALAPEAAAIAQRLGEQGA
jgi:hypothetical protein